MKIIPIRQADNRTFKGLWEEPKVKVIDTDLYYIRKQADHSYHPFADETEAGMKETLETRRFEINIPTVNNFKIENLKSEPTLGKKLSFTADEYNRYKTFYGRNLTKALKKIEAELLENNLSSYTNRGIIYSVKRFLHNLKNV